MDRHGFFSEAARMSEKEFLDPVVRKPRGLTRLFSAPILLKIAGTGILVAVIFGGVMWYLVHTTMYRALIHRLAETAECVGMSTAHTVEDRLLEGDLFSVKRTLLQVQAHRPGVSYIIVEDDRGRAVSHTFPEGVPADLMSGRPSDRAEAPSMDVFATEDGCIYESTVPLTNGSMGRVRLGMSDRMILAELSRVTTRMFITLGLCLLLGLGLAFGLAYLLSRPIQNLLTATRHVGEGRFEARARVYSHDEIGRLAMAFNRMMERLEIFRQEVRSKEAARLALIEKTVQSQEMERKSIARDLHDQLGQSLTLVLLEIQAMGAAGDPHGRCAALESRISHLIDEVHRLSWGMHPSVLDDYGLDHALARYIADVSENVRIPIDYKCIVQPDVARLPMRTESSLYRISQEALTNIVRHSQARHASVILLRNKGETTLLIEDDGIGFDADRINRNGFDHLGIVGMRERTTLLGGIFMVESVPGHGTTIRVKIPQ